ncbi:hypothetical protein BG000_002326 [Podila horticola]|nr:hypothetical protein BG000_002326 [Podila horticola]
MFYKPPIEAIRHRLERLAEFCDDAYHNLLALQIGTGKAGQKIQASKESFERHKHSFLSLASILGHVQDEKELNRTLCDLSFAKSLRLLKNRDACARWSGAMRAHCKIVEAIMDHDRAVEDLKALFREFEPELLEDSHPRL